MKDSPTISWSLAIRELRQQLHLSQERFAQRLGVSFQTVNRWESGKTNPSPMATKLIQQMLIELGKDGQDLLDQCFGD
jgi:DNA-binding transcriptional regulator YiaG